MSSIQIATVFTEDVIKAFRSHLPKECVEILIRMASEQQRLEQVLNSQQRVMRQMVQTLQTFGVHHQQLQASIDAIERKYDGSDLVSVEKMDS